jgi:hypothetical protein
MKIRWGKLAGQLGILYCLAGLVLVFLGWNGAATYDRVSAQVPYVISGGLAGLCLVVIGGSVLVAASAREGSAALQATVEELRAAVERMGGGETPGPSAGAGAPAGDEMVVAGPSSYHRPTCRMVQGQAGTTMTTASVAAARDLAACRICAPDTAAPAAGGDTAATVPGSTSASARR